MPIRYLIEEYTDLAASYDTHWSAYLDASLSMTQECIVDLAADRVLDVACGTGLLLEGLTGRADCPELFGIDRVPAMLDQARLRLGRRVTLLEADAAALPFDDAAFQLVVSTSALHYFPDVDSALQEMRRVISPAGNLVITDWSRDFFWMKLLDRLLPYTHHAHAHTFSTHELQQSLRQAGFKVASVSRRNIDWFWGLMTIHATPT